METPAEILSWSALVLGAVAGLFGAFKILKYGMMFFLWLSLTVVGFLGVDYGLHHQPPGLAPAGIPPDLFSRIARSVLAEKSLTQTALLDMCTQLAPSNHDGQSAVKQAKEMETKKSAPGSDVPTPQSQR